MADSVSKRYNITVDLAQKDSSVFIKSISATITQITAVSFLTGPTGAAGRDGLGVPAGGSTNEILAKTNNLDNATYWADIETLDAVIDGGSA